MTTIEDLNKWLAQPEGLNIEFKAAANQFSRDKDLPDYCAALANEGGGKLVLGINNDGVVVGTRAFKGTHHQLSHFLLNSIKLRVDIEELLHPNGRVLIFNVPSHPFGQTIKSSGSYRCPMRAGESLVEMDDLTLKGLLNESAPDFSAKIIPASSINDLDEGAINKLKQLCSKKTGNQNYLKMNTGQFLADLGLMVDGEINFTALILLGKQEAIRNWLPCAEIIFEWRQASGKTPYDYRKNWRDSFLNIFETIWEELDKRNLRTPYREGFIQKEILSFDKNSVREAILNAIAHRDYSLSGSAIFIKASPDCFEIESPGGFMPGITPENAINKSSWRNQRLAETLEKAGLVERSGQGLDIIYEKTIRDGKGLPNLSRSDSYTVLLEIPAVVKDPNFIIFLEKVANDKQVAFTFDEILELERIRESSAASPPPKHKSKFLTLGVIEAIGRTSGAKYILSHNFYLHEGRPGVHTRLTGLPREERKALILSHLKKNKKGLPKDFFDAFPSLKPKDISNLLQELKREKKIVHIGAKRSGYWELRAK